MNCRHRRPSAAVQRHDCKRSWAPPRHLAGSTDRVPCLACGTYPYRVTSVQVSESTFRVVPLPRVCVKTGTPTADLLTIRGSAAPGWSWVMIVFGFLPWLVANLATSKRYAIEVPMHGAVWRRHRRVRRAALALLSPEWSLPSWRRHRAAPTPRSCSSRRSSPWLSMPATSGSTPSASACRQMGACCSPGSTQGLHVPCSSHAVRAGQESRRRQRADRLSPSAPTLGRSAARPCH